MKPDYNLRDPKGWCGNPKYGAALGRRAVRGDVNYAGTMVLRKVPLDSGGYDRNGTYFGVGHPGGDLYWFASTDEEQSIEGCLRAHTRDEAKRSVLTMYPKARFYR